MSDSPDQPREFQRSIRSFVKREGKMTTGQKNAIELLWPVYGVDLDNKILDLPQLFKRDAFTILEIGFGNGLSLADMAEAHPQQNYFGVEVHAPGVGGLLVQVKKRGLVNVRVSQDDAVEVLNQQIADSSLDRVQIFFPDPWHKKRHHKRRLIQPEFVATLVKKLKPGGQIHVATDWQNYAEHVVAVLSVNEDLKNTVTGAPSAASFLSTEGEPLTDSDFWADDSLLSQGCAAKPDYRPATKYEARGIRLGHGVWDLLFDKIG